MKLDITTPGHLIRTETGVEKMLVKMATRSVKFEEKLRMLE